MTHDWSETLGIAERKQKFDKPSEKRNLKLESDSHTSGQFLIPNPYTKDRKTNILDFKTEIVNLQLFCKI